MLAFGPDGVGPAEDHDALLRFRETISILAYRATPPDYQLLAVPLLWRAGLSEETFEELTLLVEVFDGVGVVGAWTIHEFVEVVRQSLLGLPGCVISCGDQRGVVRPMPILPVLFAPLSGGAFVWIHALGLAFVTASAEDRSDRLLARGVVGGNVEQIAGGMGF